MIDDVAHDIVLIFRAPEVSTEDGILNSEKVHVIVDRFFFCEEETKFFNIREFATDARLNPFVEQFVDSLASHMNKISSITDLLFDFHKFLGVASGISWQRVFGGIEGITDSVELGTNRTLLSTAVHDNEHGFLCFCIACFSIFEYHVLHVSPVITLSGSKDHLVES